jgi:hypothetical protein
MDVYGGKTQYRGKGEAEKKPSYLKDKKVPRTWNSMKQLFVCPNIT